ncbi:MAG TPA: hypothetical protein VGI48_07940 [Caldimonas sp.]|jgi:hypothetical protein
MGFTVLFLLLLVTAGWWLHSRWSALRDAQASRREAELMVVFEARSKMGERPVTATPAPSDFYPTLPEHDAAATAWPVGAMPQARRQRAD